MGAMAEIKHPLARSVGRGVQGRCPACGEGKLFWKYLKVESRCEACDEELARYPADDGPAYLTILLVGHLLIAPLLLFPFVWEMSPWLTVPGILIPLALITLWALSRVKGGWIGLMYALGVTDRDHRLHTADAAD
jgi:uncharacterized protein (DUF983 family)